MFLLSSSQVFRERSPSRGRKRLESVLRERSHPPGAASVLNPPPELLQYLLLNWLRPRSPSPPAR